METKKELEQLGLVQLAVMCQKIADHGATDDLTAKEARQLKFEWVTLVARETPLPIKLKDNEHIQTEKQALKTRMIAFL